MYSSGNHGSGGGGINSLSQDTNPTLSNNLDCDNNGADSKANPNNTPYSP